MLIEQTPYISTLDLLLLRCSGLSKQKYHSSSNYVAAAAAAEGEKVVHVRHHNGQLAVPAPKPPQPLKIWRCGGDCGGGDGEDQEEDRTVTTTDGRDASLDAFNYVTERRKEADGRVVCTMTPQINCSSSVINARQNLDSLQTP